MSQQKTNGVTSVSLLSKKSTSTQTMNISTDQESLTYLIQGLISCSLAHFNLDMNVIFIGGKTEGVCKISSVDLRLSSVSLYCEYELGNFYISQPPPSFSGFPIILKSPFNSIGMIITGLDQSKTKFIDNINYIIEFVEMFEVEDHSINNSDPSTKTSAAPQTRTVATQTNPCIENKETLTYIAKGIMFKSICFFTWDEYEAFRFGKKEGILRLISSNSKLTGMTLTCNYTLSKRQLNFQGDVGYPIIVSCSYGSVKTLLTLDKKMIMDNSNFKLTFIS
ncbi:5723_t:CDS:1 [Funneliformis geosporum]|nr:5723_t:CDS:1 [Funneliformis geosporum]